MTRQNIRNILINLAIANTIRTYSELKNLIFNHYNDIEPIVKLRTVATVSDFVSALNWMRAQYWDIPTRERVYPEVKKHILITLT